MTLAHSADKAVLDLEALLLASPRPVRLETLGQHLGLQATMQAIEQLRSWWAPRGLNIVTDKETVRFEPSAAVLDCMRSAQANDGRRLSPSAIETLCYIAINQPVTFRDIESGRGSKTFRGVMDALLDSGFVRTSVRKTDSGRAVTYVTTDLFLDHFHLSALSDMPTLEEMDDLINPPEIAFDHQSENETPHPQAD